MILKNIKWPIYKIGSHDRIYDEYGVTYIEHYGKTSILDNKNLSGDTLGNRRLKISKDDIYNTKGSIFMFADLLEYVRKIEKSRWLFIDSSGNIFKYKKDKYISLIWRKILKVTNYTNFALLHVEDIFQTFELPFNYWSKFKDEENLYLGLLNFGSYYAIYDISTVFNKDTKRKI